MHGRIIQTDQLGIFAPPVHPHCHCVLIPLTSVEPPTPIDWDNLAGSVLRAFVRFVAWMLRKNIAVPAFLAALIPAAEEYNRERGQGQLAIDDEHFKEHLTMPDEERTHIRITAQGTLLEGDGNRPRIRIMRAGRSRPMRGFPNGIELPAAVLQAAADAGLLEGRPIFFTHQLNTYERDVRDMAAVIHSATFDGTALVASYRPYNSAAGQELQALAADLRNQREEGIPEPDVGLSFDAFFSIDREAQPPRANTIHDVLSVDIVFQPAADGRILAQAEGGQTMPELDEVTIQEEEATSAAGNGSEQPSSNGDSERMIAETQGRADAWIHTLEQQAVEARLATSNLPAPVRRRLAAGTYRQPEDLENAIADARQELADLAEGGVIQIGPRPPREGRIHGMVTGMDELQAATDWMFGDPEAETPPPHIRNIHNWYMALTGDYEFRGLFHPDRVTFTGATTGTLASMAANAMNKVIMHQFSNLTFYRWYERVSLATPNDGSVHDMQWTSVGGVSDLPTVPEKGAYSEIDMDDVKETDSFTKYGGYVPITIEMIRNSDIQRMQSVPRALAVAAVRTRSSKIAAIFTTASGAGPTLDQDSTALFHSNHSNLDTTAFGTDETAWKAAAQEMFKQTEIQSSKRLGLFPKYALVPVDLYHTALSVFGYGEGMPTSYEVFSLDRGEADPRPIPLAVPDWTDANDWAYIADPRVFPVIHISYAQSPQGAGHPPPELFAVTSPTAGLVFTNDVLPVKVRDWFAYGVNGYRGIGKRNVT